MEDRLALSALDWWEEAGVDTFVEDLPRDWLAPAAAPVIDRPPAHPAAAPAPDATPAPAALPTTLDAFRAFLLGDPALPGQPGARIAASGDPASGAMLIVDMPEATDRAEGRLLSGEAGALFDRMLGAMSLSRGSVYLAPLSPARPASGRLTPETIAALAPLALHHVALVCPKRLLLLGDAAVRALIGLGCVEARGRSHMVGGPDGPIPAIASFHPRLLVQTPARKKAAWDDLQLFMAL